MHSINQPPEILQWGGLCPPLFLLVNQKTHGVRRDPRMTADNWHSSRYRGAVMIKLLFWMNKSVFLQERHHRNHVFIVALFSNKIVPELKGWCMWCVPEWGCVWGEMLLSFGPLKLSGSRACVGQELLFTHWAYFSSHVERKVLSASHLFVPGI